MLYLHVIFVCFAFICILICDWVMFMLMFLIICLTIQLPFYCKLNVLLLQNYTRSLCDLWIQPRGQSVMVWSSISQISNIYIIYVWYTNESRNFLHFRSSSYLAKNFSWFQPFISTFLEPRFSHFLHLSLQSKWATL